MFGVCVRRSNRVKGVPGTSCTNLRGGAVPQGVEMGNAARNLGAHVDQFFENSVQLCPFFQNATVQFKYRVAL